MRFDEVELAPVIFEVQEERAPQPHWFRRILAILTDLSLFVALALALSPLLPASPGWITIGALAGFVIIVAAYYFAGCRALWGKTIGSAIW